KPAIELRDYRPPNPISLKPDKRTVTDEQVQQTLETLREQQAQLEPAPAGTALTEGDFAILDVQALLEGAPIEGASKAGHVHKVGSKTPLLGIEVDAHLLGKREGDIAEIAQPYPETHPDPRLAGKTVTFNVTVTAVKRKKLAPLDDEFAKDCGPYGSLDELKEKIRTEMEQALKRSIEEGYKDQIAKRLLETHHFDLPESLVEREVTSMVRQQLDTRRRQRGGMEDLRDLAIRQDEVKKLREEMLPEAQRRVKIGLILEAIAQKEGIAIEEADVEAEFQRLATALRISPDDIKRMLAAGGEDARDDMAARLLAEKSLDFVYRNAVIQG